MTWPMNDRTVERSPEDAADLADSMNWIPASSGAALLLAEAVTEQAPKGASDPFNWYIRAEAGQVLMRSAEKLRELANTGGSAEWRYHDAVALLRAIAALLALSSEGAEITTDGEAFSEHDYPKGTEALHAAEQLIFLFKRRFAVPTEPGE